jgi:hypothetical protein
MIERSKGKQSMTMTTISHIITMGGWWWYRVKKEEVSEE